jgi:DNA-binding MarR family transcriptional regulator
LENPIYNGEISRIDLANRIFFKLYQCANMMHKTGTRAVQDEGITTQQWAVLGALSRAEAQSGVSMGELASYLKVTRQTLAGLVGRMERDGLVEIKTDPNDRRSRLVVLSDSGRHVWIDLALPKIKTYYEQVLNEFSTSDMAHTLHYMLKLLDNMVKVDLQSVDETQ